MSKLLLHILLAGFVFLVIVGIARLTPVVAAPLFDFYEECEQEGCSNHEIEELFDSFNEECTNEGCSHEEVRELAGATSRIDNMYTAFCNLGKNFTWFHSNVSTTNCTGLVTQNLQIRRFNTVALSNAQADTILQNSTNIVQTNNGFGDVACNARFLRNGNVTAFNAVPGSFDGSIDSGAEFNAIMALAGNVKVVNQINWCSGLAPNIIGCAPTPGNSLAVVRLGTNLTEGILWAHEFGHNQGLPHRANSRAIMNATIATTRLNLTANECTAFRN